MTAQGKRGIVLGAALVVTLLLVWKVSRDDQDAPEAAVIEPVRHAATVLNLPKAIPATEGLVAKTTVTAQSRMSEDAEGDPFAPMIWFVEPKKKPPPPPPPVAPPIPFMFYGKVLGDAGLQAVLQQEDKTIVVKAGDIVEKNYRIDEIKGERLSITYLPLNQKQFLEMGKVPDASPGMQGGEIAVPGAAGTGLPLPGLKLPQEVH